MTANTLDVTVLIAARNERANMSKCLAALTPAARVIVLDSHSDDETAALALAGGAEVVQFDYRGSYPKKRQWALDTLDLRTKWVLLLDADEVVPPALWQEMANAIASTSCNGFLITKGFHFLGKRFRFGGFSFAAVLLIRRGKARFERLLDAEPSEHDLDMEVHERLIVDGTIGRLKTALIHEDFKSLQTYLDRHNRYSTWEAAVRHTFLTTGKYGRDTVRACLLGNTQERRRFLKALVIRLPFEAWLWFSYHFFLRLGFLEGRRGLIASQIRSSYISQVRAKVYELRLKKTRAKAEPPATNGV